MRGLIPQLTVSVGWLRDFGEPPKEPWDEDDAALAVLVKRGDATRVAILQPGEELKLPRITVGMASDAVALQALHRNRDSAGVIQDYGPAALWTLAQSLSDDDWLWSPETIMERATRLHAILLMCGMAVPGDDHEGLAVLRAAARIAMGASDGEILALAREANLLPLPYLTNEGFPVLMPAAYRSAMPNDAREVFRRAVQHIRAGGEIHLPPHPVPRRVLLNPPATAGDQSDEKEVERYRHLADDVARLPAPDAAEVAARLLARFPWMGEAAQVVRRELALLPPGAPAVIPPMLLLGPPGCGKTTFLKELCRAVGIPWRLLHSTDGNGATTLAGNGRGWRGGRPALPLTLMSEMSLSTVGVVVDDIDRQASDDRYGTPQSWLLSVLEPSTARHYHDPYLLCDADLSTVSWLLTANDAASIGGALLDRVAVVELGYPPPDVAELILQSVVSGVLDELGWADGALELPAGARDILLRALGHDGGTLRLLRRAVRASLGAARCREDAAEAARVELTRARSRDDRAYAAAGRVGFTRTAWGRG